MTQSGGKKTGELTPGAPASSMSKELLERVNRRDPEALGLLFDRYFQPIYSTAYRLLGNRAGAEDVVQEVFLRVHRAAHQLDPGRDPGPWLITVTANLCRERWRSKAGRQEQRTASLDQHLEEGRPVSSSAPGPDRAAQDGERDAILVRAVAQLPEDMRLAVVLHDFQGLSHADIGSMLDVEPATVRKRYSRALKKLRSLLPEGLV